MTDGVATPQQLGLDRLLCLRHLCRVRFSFRLQWTRTRLWLSALIQRIACYVAASARTRGSPVMLRHLRRTVGILGNSSDSGNFSDSGQSDSDNSSVSGQFF